MRRVIQCSAVVLISAFSIYAFAGGFDYTKEDLSGYNLQPNFKVNDESDYGRNGKSVYFFGGYVYTNRFLKSDTQTIYDPINNFTYSYSPKTLFPNTFNGFEIGAGKEVSRYINFEMAYQQQLVKNMSGTVSGVPFSTSVKMNGLLADMGIVFNPDDAFQFIGLLGAQLAQFTTTASVASSPSFTFSNSTKVDPAIGLELLCQFNPNIGFRLDAVYVADSQSSNSSGEANILAGLNYTL